MNSIVEAVAVAADRKPDAIAVIAERQEITYGELWKEVRGFAAYLQSHGLEKGSRVIVKSKHSIWYVVAFLGIHLAGCVHVPVAEKIGLEGLKDIARQFSPFLIISDVDMEDGGYPTIDSSSVREFAVNSFLETISFDFPQPEDLCDILFTTGTTGKSKGVMLTHGAVVAVTENYQSLIKIPDDNIYLIPTPVNHSGGLRKIYVSLLTATTAVLLDGYSNLNNLKLLFECIRDYHVTSIHMSPYVVRLVLLLAAGELAKYANQIDHILTAGTAFPEVDQERLCELLPHTRLYFLYGASEAGTTSILEYSKEKKEVCCVGKPTAHSHVFILDDNRKEIQSSKDNPGLIAISGLHLMSGYYNEPELTKEVLAGGVLYTNDIGYIDEAGYLYVLGRMGDVIDMDGYKIAPTEVEDIALRFPGVAECVCFAVQNTIGGMDLKLNIVEESGCNVHIIKLCEYMRRNLETYKVPKRIEKVSEIPRTANGKIDRKVLKQYLQL